MAEEKSLIEVLERQIELIKQQEELTEEQVEIAKKQKDIADELSAMKDIVRLQIKAQKELQATLFGKQFVYDKKEKTYSKELE